MLSTGGVPKRIAEASFDNPGWNPNFRYDEEMSGKWIAASWVSWLLLAGYAGGQESKATGSAGCGALTGQVFKCPKFGFTYPVPFGWVNRTEDMQQQAMAGAPQESGTQPNGKSETLLAIFERPPGASGETINSAVVFAAESLKDYHGIKSAADYLGPVTELAEQRGFKMQKEPYEFTAGARRLVRADYSKKRGKLEMWQSTLVIIEKGEILSFTFVGGSDEDVENLVWELKFNGGAAPK